MASDGICFRILALRRLQKSLRCEWRWAMWGLLVVFLTLAAAPGFADVVVDPSGPWRDRIDTCVALWERGTVAQQGTMTYRQFTSKCVSGKTALPFRTEALCEDGTRSSGTA